MYGHPSMVAEHARIMDPNRDKDPTPPAGALLVQEQTALDFDAAPEGVAEAAAAYHPVSETGLFLVADDGTLQPAPAQIVMDSAIRWLDASLRRDKESIHNPADMSRYFTLKLGALEHEVFACVFLDAQHRVIEYKELFRGTLTQTSVYPREIVKESLTRNAAAICIAHNHPSGLPEPSNADKSLTNALKQALALIDVRVLDHFVVGGGQAISFAERGLM